MEYPDDGAIIETIKKQVKEDYLIQIKENYYIYSKKGVIRQLWQFAKIKRIFSISNFLDDCLLILKLKFFVSEKEIIRRLLN